MRSGNQECNCVDIGSMYRRMAIEERRFNYIGRAVRELILPRCCANTVVASGNKQSVWIARPCEYHDAAFRHVDSQTRVQ